MANFCTYWKNLFEFEINDNWEHFLDELSLSSPDLLSKNMSHVNWKLPADCILKIPIRLNMSGETLENGMLVQNRGAVESGFLIEFELEANGVQVPICPSLLGDEQYSRVTGSYGLYETIYAREISVNGEPFLPSNHIVNSRLWGLYKQDNHNQINGILPKSPDGAAVVDIFLEFLSKSLGEAIVLRGIESFIDDAVNVIQTVNECWKLTADLVSQS